MYVISKLGQQFVASYTYRVATKRHKTNWTKFPEKAMKYELACDARSDVKKHRLSSCRVYELETLRIASA